ncbi:MAG: hypothetical protein QOG03_1032 [Actinomycetota bacterium]|jgi:hypothetical protein|nr:hypothetical protein [Actinomycetota bacterium]
MPALTLDAAADRLAALLMGTSTLLGDPDPSSANLEFEDTLEMRPLHRSAPPADVWACDGGQAVVADARCVALVVTRAARVRFQDGACVLEDEGELRGHLLGGSEGKAAMAGLGLGIEATTTVDLNLLRDHGEWKAVAACVEEADPGAVVLVDGDLVPDWRIPSSFVGRLLDRAAERGVLIAGVTKRSSLSRGGAPLLGQLESEGQETYGKRGMWFTKVAHTRPDLDAEGPGLQVVAARLDPDAPFAFRIDLPAGIDAEEALAKIAALCDDAAFPGYPYPLTVADRLAACPGWLKQEVRMQLDDHFDRAGVPLDVRERAFTDRHDLMERF